MYKMSDYKADIEIAIFHKLLDLKFSIKSYGFDFWKMAIYYYNDFPNMVDLYKYIGLRYGKSWKSVEIAMRRAIDNNTKKMLQEYYNIDNYSNIVIWRLISTEFYSVKEV